MKPLVLGLAVIAGLSAAPAGAPRTFTGVITDDMCARPHGHDQMRMGPTDAECTRECVVVHGAAFVLYDGTNVYDLTDQNTPDRFAGQKVRITGELDPKTKTIRVRTITAAR